MCSGNKCSEILAKYCQLVLLPGLVVGGRIVGDVVVCGVAVLPIK